MGRKKFIVLTTLTTIIGALYIRKSGTTKAETAEYHS